MVVEISHVQNTRLRPSASHQKTLLLRGGIAVLLAYNVLWTYFTRMRPSIPCMVLSMATTEYDAPRRDDPTQQTVPEQQLSEWVRKRRRRRCRRCLIRRCSTWHTSRLRRYLRTRLRLGRRDRRLERGWHRETWSNEDLRAAAAAAARCLSASAVTKRLA